MARTASPKIHHSLALRNAGAVTHAMPAVGLVAGLMLALAVVSQGLRLQRVWRCIGARPALPFQRPAPHGAARILILGDSTAVGVGASHPRESLGGLIASNFPGLHIENRAVAGATLADVGRQLDALPAWRGDAYDVVLMSVGGNDVLHRTPLRRLARQADALLHRLRGSAHEVLWLGCANIGSAPLFVPPWSWWLTARTRRVSRMLNLVAAQHGVRFVSFFRERRQDVFASHPARYFAPDGVHPSSASYKLCYAQFRATIWQALRPRDCPNHADCPESLDCANPETQVRDAQERSPLAAASARRSAVR